MAEDRKTFKIKDGHLVSLIVYAAVVLLVLTPFPGLQQVVADMVEGLVRVQNLPLRWIEQLPWASIDHVWVDMWDVVLFYFCLLLVCRKMGGGCCYRSGSGQYQFGLG